MSLQTACCSQWLFTQRILTTCRNPSRPRSIFELILSKSFFLVAFLLSAAVIRSHPQPCPNPAASSWTCRHHMLQLYQHFSPLTPLIHPSNPVHVLLQTRRGVLNRPALPANVPSALHLNRKIIIYLNLWDLMRSNKRILQTMALVGNTLTPNNNTLVQITFFNADSTLGCMQVVITL